MSEQRKRQRAMSLIKLSSQKKESKQRYEEANSHIKNGNLDRAIFSFDKLSHVLRSLFVIDSDAKAKTGLGDHSEKASSKNLDDSKKKLKRKRRKNVIRTEEVYCDKDRAAAVNLGSKDIKQSLKLKRKQDRTRIMQIPEEAEPGTFLALGNYEMCRGDLNIAVNFIGKALELNPSEKNALVARSRCHILLGQPKKALEDAEFALQIDKNFIKAIYQKAEALYYLGDFELSLMYYHRGLHVRPDHEGFKLGVHKAQKAIENAIGSSLGFPKQLNSSKASARSAASEKTNATETGRASALVSNKSKPHRKTKILGELHADREYLDSLMKNPNLKCKFKKDDSKLENCIKETVDYLNERQEFWRQQMPPTY